MHSTSIYHLLITSTLLLYSVIRGGCFTCHNHGNQSQKRYEIPIRYFGKIEPEKEGVRLISWSRRAILGSGVLFLPQTGTSVAETQISIPNLDSLMDLPPITEGCLRIFLCRHGQTENNRLRKVQGARVDPPINQNGIQQAINLGQSLCRVDPTPNLFFSSNLQRAQMTAKIAANEIDPNINVQSLHFLSEVDFGPIADGQPLALAKAGMQATYAAWATGRIDYRPQGGQGESGREVLNRAAEAIREMIAVASRSQKESCVAVTHSTFLRILLAMMLDRPLFEASSMSVVNGGVSIIDVPRELRTRHIGKTSNLFVGTWNQDIGLEVPICRVIRINETRHLPTVPVLI